LERARLQSTKLQETSIRSENMRPLEGVRRGECLVTERIRSSQLGVTFLREMHPTTEDIKSL
jgi:hypothetical protein